MPRTSARVRSVGEIRQAMARLTWLINRAPDDDDTRYAEALLCTLEWVLGEGAADPIPEVLSDIAQMQAEARKGRCDGDTLRHPVSGVPSN